MSNIVLRYGSFNTVKRAEALARVVGELGAAVRALTSEGVLGVKEHTQKPQALHPHEDLPMMPDSLDSMHSDSSSHAHKPFTSTGFMWSVKECKAEESSRCTRVEGRHHQAMNSEAVNAICKL